MQQATSVFAYPCSPRGKTYSAQQIPSVKHHCLLARVKQRKKHDLKLSGEHTDAYRHLSKTHGIIYTIWVNCWQL